MLIGKDYDGIKVDIWSTGIILYAMLCGCVPFNDDNRFNLYKKILKCQISFPENLEEDAIDLLKKILVNNPNKRISIKDIKKHPFYLKGRREFVKMHPNLIKVIMKKDVKINRESYRSSWKNGKKNNSSINLELMDNKGKKVNKKIKNNKTNENIKNKIKLDTLTLRFDRLNINNQEISNNENHTHIIEFNKKNGRQNEKRKRKSLIYRSVIQKDTEKINSPTVQKCEEDNLDSNINKLNTEISTEFNTLDFKNKINYKKFTDNKKCRGINDNNSINKNMESYSEFKNIVLDRNKNYISQCYKSILTDATYKEIFNTKPENSKKSKIIFKNMKGKTKKIKIEPKKNVKVASLIKKNILEKSVIIKVNGNINDDENKIKSTNNQYSKNHFSFNDFNKVKRLRHKKNEENKNCSKDFNCQKHKQIKQSKMIIKQ